MRRAHRRQHPVVAIRAIGAEAGLGHDPAALEMEQPALGDLVLAQREPERALDDLERGLRRGEEHLAPRAADPERAGDAAGEVQPAVDTLVDPGGRHRAAQLLERRVIRPRQLHEGEDRLGVDGHVGLGPLDRVPGEDLLVVDDDPVVDPDDRAVPDRMVVGENGGVALGVVTHVHQRVGRVGRAARPRRAVPWRRSAACESSRSSRRRGGRSRPHLHRAPRSPRAAPGLQGCDRRWSQHRRLYPAIPHISGFDHLDRT